LVRVDQSSSKRKAETPAEEPPTPDAAGSKKKARKDPKAPKGARTAYSLFMEEQHAIVKAANPEASFAQLSKQVGEKWKSLTADDKAKYEALALADKDRYD
jgi:structure-specific recognition protein 1